MKEIELHFTVEELLAVAMTIRYVNELILDKQVITNHAYLENTLSFSEKVRREIKKENTSELGGTKLLLMSLEKARVIFGKLQKPE